MALVALVILTGVMVTAAAEVRIVQRTQLHRLEQRKAERAAQAGIVFALAQMGDVNTARVTFDDDWAQIGAGGTQEIVMGNAVFRVQVLDAASLSNLNTMTQEQWEKLPLSAEQISAVLDWREADLQPRFDGAKDEYYNSLSKPYNTKLRNFDTIQELLMVRGFDANLLYEPVELVSGTSLSAGNADQQPSLYSLLTVDSTSSNVSPVGQPKTNVNTASAGQLVQAGLDNPLAQAIVNRRNQQGTYTSWSQLLQVPGVTMQNVSLLLDGLTLDTTDVVSGRVNINTATEQTLNLLPGMTTDVAQAILSRQGTFQGVGDIAGTPGLSLALIGQFAGSITVSSRAFIVRCVGVLGSAQVALEATVLIEDSGARVLRIQQSPFIDAPLRWGWDEEPETQTVFIEGD